MKKFLLILSLFFFQVTSAQLVINEVLYDPPSGLDGDANGDGVRDATDDEFIEFVNNSATALDVSGYKIYDILVSDGTRTLRHTIPDNTILPPHGILVVFGGGTPTGNFGGATVIADTGSAGLSLNNSGERIEVDDASDTTILTFDSDAESNNPDESYTRFPDITGGFVQHEQDASTDGITTALFSPGTMVTVTTWTGNGDTDTDWDTSSNWSNGVPTSVATAIVPNITNDPVSTGAVSAYNMVIQSDAALTIGGAMNNTGVVTIYSGGSLISQTSASGNITYQRDLSTSNFYLISSPVEGQDVDDFVATSGLQAGSVSSTNLGLGTYTTASDTWTFYQDGTSNSDTFTAGVGHSINLDAASGTISFTGTMLTTDLSSISLTTTGNGFNLIGNPYPSYINSASILTGSTDALASQTIWIWNQATSSYDTHVTGDNFQLAPGQGFFVQSDGSAGDVDILESFQSHQSSDTFKNISRPEIHVHFTDETQYRKSKIYYIDGTTTGFDNGYDGPMFGGVNNDVAIYTHAVANGEGRNLAIQSLPNSDHGNMIIPVGINSPSGSKITISLEVSNLPAGLKVYLEDKQENSFTRLDEANSSFTTTLLSDLNGIGRFYLHTTENTLSSDNPSLELENISIYTSEKNNLRIVGLERGNAQVRIFNILGANVLNTNFIANHVNDISLPSLRSGMYIIQLETETGKLNRKIIIE